jgi:uncharacterized tellurite resistance protein B-like protein
MFRSYPRNSPEAVARLLAMAMMTDGEVDDAEIALFDRLDLFRMIGLSRQDFAQVLSDYCADLRAADGAPLAADAAVVDAVIASVDDPHRRLMACAAMLSVCYADGRFDTAELSVMRHVLRRWNLTVESLQGLDVPPPRARPSRTRPVARHLRRERRWGEEAGEGRRREAVLAE